MAETLIVQEIDDHIKKNNLTELELLQLRVSKHNFIKVLQIKDDVEEVKEEQCNVADDLEKNPSLVYIFRNDFKKFLALFGAFIFFISASHFVLRVVEILTGLDGLLKTLTP